MAEFVNIQFVDTRLPSILFQNARGPRKDQIEKAMSRKSVEDKGHQMRVISIEREGDNNDKFVATLARWDVEADSAGHTTRQAYDGSVSNLALITKNFGRDTLIEIQSQVDYKSRTTGNRDEARKKMETPDKAKDAIAKLLHAEKRADVSTCTAAVPEMVARLYSGDAQKQGEWFWDSFSPTETDDREGQKQKSFTAEWNDQLCLVLVGALPRPEIGNDQSMRAVLGAVLKDVKHHLLGVRVQGQSNGYKGPPREKLTPAPPAESTTQNDEALRYVFQYFTYDQSKRRQPPLLDVKHVLRIASRANGHPKRQADGIRVVATGDRIVPVCILDHVQQNDVRLKARHIELYASPWVEAPFKFAWVDPDRVGSAPPDAPRWAQFAIKMLQGIDANAGVDKDGYTPVEDALEVVAKTLFNPKTDKRSSREDWRSTWAAFKNVASEYHVRRVVLSATVAGIPDESGGGQTHPPLIVFRDDPPSSSSSSAAAASLCFEVKKFNAEWINKTMHVERPLLRTAHTPTTSTSPDDVKQAKRLLTSLVKRPPS